MTKRKLITHLISCIAVAFFLVIAFGSDDDKTTESTSTKKSTSTTVPKEVETPEELTKEINREIAKFNKPFKSSSYSGKMELVVFSVWQEIIRDGQGSNIKNQKLASELKKKVVNLQVKEFPKMRKRYCKALAEKLWENDIYVSVQGNKNEIINFSAGVFAANKNIQETQNTLDEILTEFRFKETRFRWYKEADQYTSYKIESPKDKELVKIDLKSN